MRVIRVPAQSVFQWRVPSKSKKGKYHIVSWSKDEGYVCDCEGYAWAKKHGHDCRHIRQVKNYFKGLIYEGENYKRKSTESEREVPDRPSIRTRGGFRNTIERRNS